MENVPQAKTEIPNYANYQPDQEMFRLRRRLGDLIRLGAATPETFQQTILQLWQENERRRQACLSEAEEHLRKYHTSVAQANVYAMQSSIAYAVVNGYVTIEERRVLELQQKAEREALDAKEKAEEEAKKEPPPTNGHSVQVAAVPAPAAPAEAKPTKSTGVKRKKR